VCWNGSARATRWSSFGSTDWRHLLEVIERLEAKGAFFRSIQDPIDTGSPQGKFTLQVLGAAAEFERALIRERTPRVRTDWQPSSVKMLLERARKLGLLPGSVP